MAITVEQSASSSNGLAQTFNTVLAGAPTEGNLVVALSWHDENATDVEGISSTGWTRMATSVFDLSGFAYRASVWAKIAGAGESATIAWDLGEVNRRAHGWAVEISGQQFTELQAADAADFVDGERDPAGTSLQVDNPIDIGSAPLAFAICGTNNSSATTPSWATEITNIGSGLNSNFRSTGIGFAEGVATIQPTATWGNSRQATQIVAVIGIPPPASKLLAGSSFTVRATAA